MKRSKVLNIRGFGYRYEVIYDADHKVFKAYKLVHAYNKYGYPTEHRNMIGKVEDFRDAVRMVADDM